MLANNLKLSVPLQYLGSSLVFSWGLSLEGQLSPASSVLPLITIVGGRCWGQKSCQSPYISKCQMPAPQSVTSQAWVGCLYMSTVHGPPWESAEVVLESEQEQKISLLKCYALMLRATSSPEARDSKPLIGVWPQEPRTAWAGWGLLVIDIVTEITSKRTLFSSKNTRSWSLQSVW